MTSVSLMLQTTMRVQQSITGLAIKGDQALSFMYPARERPEWAVFDEDEASGGDTSTVKGDPAAEVGGIGRFALYSTPLPAVEATTGPAAKPTPAAKPAPAVDPAKQPAEAAAGGGESEVAEYLNYDALTLAQLRSRLRTLTADELTELLDHERAGSARSPYLTMLENRIASTSGK